MIQNLQQATLNDFRAGRQTARNLTNMIPEACLVASDVMFLGDSFVRKRKGYTKVLGAGAQVIRLFDYQRQSDQQQFLVLNYGVNMVPDSDGTGLTWTVNGTLPFTSSGGAISGGKWAYTGTGSASGFQIVKSKTFTVVPGTAYTLSGYIDATHVTGATGSPSWLIYDPTVTTQYGGKTQANGVNGRVTFTFTIPAGVTQVVCLPDTGNCTVTNATALVFSDPQLEIGSTATSYAPTKLAFTKNDGSAGLTVLSTLETSTNGFSFIDGSSMGLYMSNGVNAYAEYNVSGTETLWSFGLDAPLTAPTISLGTGTLSLDFGRQYSFCNVSKWADDEGTNFIHVGPPSPISADTGPFTNKVVNLGGLTASTNPRVTHKWIFGTTDAADGQGGNLIFVGEVSNATTSFGDSLTVELLDSTRVLPVDNLPPPPYQWAVEYQGRTAIMGLPGDPDAIYCSGLSEIDLGIPQESFPSAVRFRVPGKVKKISGGVVFSQTLMVATPKMWFRVSGFDANTFQKDDDIIEPGCAGFQAVTVVQNQMVWLGPDKKLWGWDFASAPIDLSAKLSQPIPGLRSMADITDAQLPNAIVRVYNFGRYHLIFVGVSTDGSGGISWLQAYDASSLVGSSGYRTMLSDGSNVGLTESDFNFAHRMNAMSPVDVGNTAYMFFGGTDGNVYRWPDGPNCDAGVATITNVSLTSNVATITAANSFIAGGKVALAGLTTSTFLNGQTLTVASATATQFTAAFTHANVSSHSDTGTVTGNLYAPQWGSIWLNHKMPGIAKKYMWVDLTTDRRDALGKYAISAVSSDGVDMARALVSVPTQPKPSRYGVDPTLVRGSLLSQAETANGQWMRMVVTFPSDTADASLSMIDASAVPLSAVNP